MPETIHGEDRLAVVQQAARQYLDDGTMHGPWFELGGSSVDAARFVSGLERELGLAASLKDLLTTDSVADYLAHVARQDAPAAGNAPTSGGSGSTAGVGGADLLWPALAQLPARERIRVAHRILEDLLQRDPQLR